MPWADSILKQFEIADRYSTDETEYFGPYNTLLTDFFRHTEHYQVVPYYKAPITSDSTDFITRLIVRYMTSPVFFIDIKPVFHLDDISTRAKADEQIREQFKSIVGQNLVIPKLYGISAIGTRFSVYHYNKETRILSPPSVPRDSMQLADIAPVNQWNIDLLENAGEEKFKEIVAEIKAMCEAIKACGFSLIISTHPFHSTFHREKLPLGLLCVANRKRRGS